MVDKERPASPEKYAVPLAPDRGLRSSQKVADVDPSLMREALTKAPPYSMWSRPALTNHLKQIGEEAVFYGNSQPEIADRRRSEAEDIKAILDQNRT